MVEIPEESDQTLKDGFQLLIGLAEIHAPRMWVESDEGESQVIIRNSHEIDDSYFSVIY